MDYNVPVVLILAVVGIVVLVEPWRGRHQKGRVAGIQETMREITRGISQHYEHQGQDLPERVTKAVDEMKERVAKAATVKEKCNAYEIHLWSLGNLMGEACWHSGFEEGQRFSDPRKGEIRIDLTEQELLNIHWLAHYGFENMMPNYAPLRQHHFSSEEDAERATHAVETLERAVPKKHRDPSDPYALAFNRQTMIWDQWPGEKQKPMEAK
jgi:hypothetical protein